MKEEPIYCKALDAKRIKSAYCPELECENCLEYLRKYEISAPIGKEYLVEHIKISIKEPAEKRKLSRYDRLQATLRHPDFIKEYEEYKEAEKRLKSVKSLSKISFLKIAPMRVKLIAKWNIDFYYIVNRDKIKPEIMDCVTAVGYIYKKPYTICINSKENPSAYLEGERLYLKVDIRESITDLEKAFKGIIRRYKELYKKPYPEKEKRISTSFGEAQKIWEIYDLHNYENLSIDDTAEKLNLSYNDVYNACYKASEIIYQVGEEAKLNRYSETPK